jgi:hypothetical protein
MNNIFILFLRDINSTPESSEIILKLVNKLNKIIKSLNRCFSFQLFAIISNVLILGITTFFIIGYCVGRREDYHFFKYGPLENIINVFANHLSLFQITYGGHALNQKV